VEPFDVRERELSLPSLRVRPATPVKASVVRRDPDRADAVKALSVRRLPHAMLVAV
jgi:hypothetical protein